MRDGAEIGPETRILTVADVLDAPTSPRLYRPALPAKDVLAMMAGEIAIHDPASRIL